MRIQTEGTLDNVKNIQTVNDFTVDDKLRTIKRIEDVSDQVSNSESNSDSNSSNDSKKNKRKWRGNEEL
jgi:hypothetical protein